MILLPFCVVKHKLPPTLTSHLSESASVTPVSSQFPSQTWLVVSPLLPKDLIINCAMNIYYLQFTLISQEYPPLLWLIFTEYSAPFSPHVNSPRSQSILIPHSSNKNCSPYEWKHGFGDHMVINIHKQGGAEESLNAHQLFYLILHVNVSIGPYTLQRSTGKVGGHTPGHTCCWSVALVLPAGNELFISFCLQLSNF